MYLSMTAIMKVMPGMRLNMAVAKVAEVYAKLCKYKFWPSDPLHVSKNTELMLIL